MGMHAIGNGTDQLEHQRADGTEHQGHVWSVDRAGVEEGLQAGELIVFADEVQALSGAEAVEDSTQCSQVFAHPRRRR
ncbi:hypothetical protein D3C85_1128690 [compost metagenome]